MPDLNHSWGEDLQVSATGDVSVVDGTALGEQRVLRRLLTNPGDYIWHPTYGAGLPAKVGGLMNVPALKALIRSQMALEAVVAKSPPPVIDVVKSGPSSVAISIRYNDAQSGQQAGLSFDLNG